mmetsp:Transcript_3121/g.6277  ORF Transcript_3121/g.6277 Transcript_3121/m.6277 type:complete len:89 (+) Transcript_3121:142-408(+)
MKIAIMHFIMSAFWSGSYGGTGSARFAVRNFMQQNPQKRFWISSNIVARTEFTTIPVLERENFVSSMVWLRRAKKMRRWKDKKILGLK